MSQMRFANTWAEGSNRMQRTEKRRWQRLHQDDGVNYVLEPRDSEAIISSFDELYLACDFLSRTRHTQQQLHDLLDVVSDWLKSKGSEIETAHLGFEADGLKIAIVRRSFKFDPVFESELAELEIKIANTEAINQIPLTLLSLPCSSGDAVRSFLKPSFTWTSATE